MNVVFKVANQILFISGVYSIHIYIHIVKDNLCSAQYKHYFRVLMEMVFDDDDNDA